MSASFPLASRIALITGATSGLGKATAKRFLEQGAKVVLCDLQRYGNGNGNGNDNDNDNDANNNGNYGISELYDFRDANGDPTAVFCPTDVTEADQVAIALDTAEDCFGRPVDTVVNCAGIGLARKTISLRRPPDEETTTGTKTISRVHDLEAFERVLSVNVSGTFNVVRLAVERMVRAGSTSANSDIDGESARRQIPEGVIINTASIAASDGQIGQVAYAASKGAIVGMTLPLARDLAKHGIRANAIAPGLFRTPLLEGLPKVVREELGRTVPFPSRLGDPVEFAMLVQSIVENPMINGEVIRIDGALRMPPS